MDQTRVVALTEIAAMLTAALKRADNLKENMLGAKIDEALTCVVEISLQCAGNLSS